MAVAVLPPVLVSIGHPDTGDLATSALGYVEIGVQMGRGGVSFDRLRELEIKSLVDELPAGDISPIYEGDGDAFGAGAAGATNAVDVCLFVFGTLMVCLLYTSPSPRDS